MRGQQWYAWYWTNSFRNIVEETEQEHLHPGQIGLNKACTVYIEMRKKNIHSHYVVWFIEIPIVGIQYSKSLRWDFSFIPV